MQVDGKSYETIWLHPQDRTKICVIDQRLLPHRFVVRELSSFEDMRAAIADMVVRGAPLIGVAAAYGVYLGALEAHGTHGFEQALAETIDILGATRPTAVNLIWALSEQRAIVEGHGSPTEKTAALLANAQRLAKSDISTCQSIGEHGLNVIRQISRQKGGGVVNILTHCNAGWLCAVDWGTATAPIYMAYNEGIPVHIWVDETRPRNQGASLTAWELGQHGVDYTLIADNAGGHLMQIGQVDMVIVGTDRVARNGDVANKIGTYLKALAAQANSVPFYVAAPSSSIDWATSSGADIPIEQRHPDEVKLISGLLPDGTTGTVLISPPTAKAANFGFDVTPNHLVSGLITERGISKASEADLLSLFPEKRPAVAHER